MSTRAEAFLSDPQGRDNVTDAELALDRDGKFLGLRAKIVAAAGAYLQAGMPLYPALFGRDTLTAGWQAAWVDRGQSLDASLTRLGRDEVNEGSSKNLAEVVAEQSRERRS